MAKGRRANGHDRKDSRHMVRAVADVLAGGDPTPFEFEGRCRHNLRSGLCLQGTAWGRADAFAADIVRRALELLNVVRPPWLWGQREYTWDSSGTRIGYSHCLECGERLPEGRTKFCASGCGDRFRRAFQSEAFRAHECERALAYLQARRDRAEPMQCEACGAWFRSAKTGQRFCSRQCSGGRSVKEKMNGKHHPWANGNGKIGAGDANGATGLSEKMPTPAESTAQPNARNGHMTSFSNESEPRSAASSSANSAASTFAAPGGKIANTVP